MRDLLHTLSEQFPDAAEQLGELGQYLSEVEPRLHRFVAYCALNNHLPVVLMYREYEAALAQALWQYPGIQEVPESELSSLSRVQQTERAQRIERRKQIAKAAARSFVNDPRGWTIKQVAERSEFTSPQIISNFLNRSLLTIAICEHLIEEEPLIIPV